MGPFGGWHVDDHVAELIRYGRMREAILVAVDNTVDRQCEYTPAANPSCAHDQCATPTGNKYAAFLRDELKPQIDATYRTLTDADNTGAMGSSMGGLISLWLGWWYNDTFRKIGSLSTAYHRCATINDELDDPPKRPIRIYKDAGTSGDFSNCTPCYDNFSAVTNGPNAGQPRTIQAIDRLMRNGYVIHDDLEFFAGYGDAHNEIAWDKRCSRALVFLFPTSDEPNTVLDTAAPPSITNYQLAGDSNVLTWTSYRLRTYTVQGITNESLPASITWSNLFTTPVPEPRLWSYPSLGVTNSFHFLRVRENAVPNWPN